MGLMITIEQFEKLESDNIFKFCQFITPSYLSYYKHKESIPPRDYMITTTPLIRCSFADDFLNQNLYYIAQL